ncbi:adhesion G-protein coupled receptor G7-like [Archocentrus centrarchus]|uniref:adhesion G-protein coupled receptor G7-like n=1 Tax=Archocentrus centrarchus TaxID=63155 RepID=UPI0011EA4143|nr:adhesion G-protein coupled receptor G7-like [Archocentrus centrarchus]
MDGWLWLVFTLALPLASYTAGATTHIPDPTTTALLPTADPDHTTTTQITTTADSINSVTPEGYNYNNFNSRWYYCNSRGYNYNNFNSRWYYCNSRGYKNYNFNSRWYYCNSRGYKNYNFNSRWYYYSTTVTPEGTTTTTLTPDSTTVTPEGTTTTTLSPDGTTVTPEDGTTTSQTTVTFPTTTALKCYNGGKIVNGVCICPDAWTGHTCAIVNFCEAQRLEGFSFPPTPIGWFAYSKEKCEAGTSGTGKPQASTRCLLMKKSPRFNPPKTFECDLTLSDIQNFTSANLETVATSAQILTSNPEELTAENVTAATQIANTLLLSANATESITVAAVATISQLLNATVPEDTKENNAALGLTLTLDQLSVNLSLHASQSQVVQPNLVVQSAQVPAADTQGVQFTSLRGTSGNFVANRIQLNTNATQIEVENGFIADALIYLRFPPGEAVRGGQTDSNVSLGFVLYQNDRFFHSKLYTRRRANIRVLSASVKGQEGRVVPAHVEMLFSPRLMDGTSLYDFSCVFWNYSLKDWSTAGCSKGNTSDGLMRCFCNHTTNFAALWSYRENYEYAEALGVISIVGLSASMLALAVTIIHHVRENFHRKSRELQTNLNSKLALLCIYFSLLAFIITFLSGVQNSSRQNDAELQVRDQTNDLLDSDERREPDRGSCTAVAALLHFLLMATFMWNSVYATQLVLLVRSLRRSLPAHWTPLSLALGFGVPACLVAVTLGVSYRVDHPLGYRQEEFCWLAALDKNKRFSFGKPMFWGFLLPVGLILTYSIILLVLISMTTCKADPKLTSNKDSSLRKKFLISLSLAVLLGLSWTLGYLVLLSSGKTHLVFSILFCLCTTTQGLQIFILFTARTRAFRVVLSRSVQYPSTVSIPLSSTKYHVRKNWDTNQSETYRDLSDGDTITSNTLWHLREENCSC